MQGNRFFKNPDNNPESSSDEWQSKDPKTSAPVNGIHTTTNNINNDKNTEAVTVISSSRPEDLSDIKRIVDPGNFSSPQPKINTNYSSPQLSIESFAPKLKLITYNESKFFFWSEINKLICNFTILTYCILSVLFLNLYIT